MAGVQYNIFESTYMLSCSLAYAVSTQVSRQIRHHVHWHIDSIVHCKLQPYTQSETTGIGLV